MLRAVKRFIQIVLLILLSPFVFLMLGIALAVVRFGEFRTAGD